MRTNQLAAKQQVTKTVNMLINGSATSASSGNLKGATIVGLYVPSGIASTSMTFQFSHDGDTWYPVKNGSGSASTVTIAAGDAIPFDVNFGAMARYIKLVASTTETNKTFILVTRPLA